MAEESSDGVLLTVVKAVAAFASVAIFLYLEEPRVRWAVDGWLTEVGYRARLAEWKARTWHRWPTWRRERYEELHGPLEG